MNRLLVIAFLLMVAISRAQSVVYLNSTDNIGTSRTNLNANFSNMLPVAQAAYSNTHVVTHQASETNFLQWVSRSSDGKTNYWLACFTNGAAGAAATPQGPWTNWISAATFGVSNAGTFNMASSNIVLITLGTNRLTVQGTAAEPTNVAWNGNSLWNIGGGSLGLWATNAHLGPVTALHFIGTASVTGEEGYVTAGAGGTAVGIFSNGTFVANSTNINFVGSGVGAITGNTVNIIGGGGVLSTAYSDYALLYATNTYTWNNTTFYTQTWDRIGNNDAGTFRTNAFRYSSTGLVHIICMRQMAAGATANTIFFYIVKNGLLVNDGSYLAMGVAQTYAPNGSESYCRGSIAFYNDAATNNWDVVLYQSSGTSRATDAANMGANYLVTWRTP